MNVGIKIPVGTWLRSPYAVLEDSGTGEMHRTDCGASRDRSERIGIVLMLLCIVVCGVVIAGVGRV